METIPLHEQNGSGLQVIPLNSEYDQMESFPHSSHTTLVKKKKIKEDPSTDFFVNPALAQSA